MGKFYIKALYSKNFSVEKAELDYLIQRMQLLKELSERLCKQKIEELGHE